MSSRRYLNFDLLLEQEGDGQYQARVTDSPLGETPSVRFRLPYDATTLENLLLKLDPGRSGTRRVGSTSQQQAAMDFGGPLFQAVFTGDLALAWQRSLDRAGAEDASGLRLRLRLNDAAAIAGLPWELLYDARSNNFLAQSERTPLVRFLDVPQTPRPITVDGPLRVLAIISSPSDLEELDVEAEWQRIGEALAPRVQAGLVVVDRLPSATIGDLGAWLRRNQTHVIHFVGHGDFDEGLREGVIYFQDRHGRSSAVTSSVLGPYVRDHDPLRMVVLNACRSARVDGVDPFGGMAQGLVQQDATAVVAMQFPISDRAAVTFTGEFYGALVDGLPVDQAVSSARKALLADFRDEWATPVLFMRSPDGNIFENVHAVAGGVPSPPEPEPPEPPVPPVPPEPEPPEPPVPPVPPVPAPWLVWVRRHVPLVVAAAVALVALVVVAVVVLPGGGGDDVPPNDDDDRPDGFELALPTSDPLPPTQLLVAAGPSSKKMRLWLLDVTSTARSHEVTIGNRNEWLPVLGPDRSTVVYSRQELNSVNDYQLRVAAAETGEGARDLFTPPAEECSRHTGRPAWGQPAGTDTAFLVMRCIADDDNELRLVKIDASGDVEVLPVLDENGQPWPRFGDPTISPDGSTVVLWVSDDTSAEGGALWSITLADKTSHPLLAEERPRQFSDPVFSPVLDAHLLAFRNATGGPTGFDVWTVGLSEDGASAGVPAPLVTQSGSDEDPSFSPDGSEVVYTNTAEGSSHLMRVSLAPSSTPVAVPVPADFPPVVKVPAWTTR